MKQFCNLWWRRWYLVWIGKVHNFLLLCFFSSLLVNLFVMDERYASFFFFWRGGGVNLIYWEFYWGRRKISVEIVEVKFMILYSLFYTVNVFVKYAFDLDNYVMYAFILDLIELICIMIWLHLEFLVFYFKWISFMCATSYIIVSFFVGNILVK